MTTRCALAHRIPVRGTLGLALLAKRHGKIAAARPLLELMRQQGMYLSDTVPAGAVDGGVAG